MEEVEYQVKEHSPELLYIIDDTFLARPLSELREFAKRYNKYKIPFWMNTRPETLTKEKLDLLKEMNCFRISIGIECGNEEFRDTLNRHISNKVLIERIDLLKTRELIFETIELNRKLSGYDSITVSVFTPYHGCELREKCVNQGILNKDTLTGHTTELSMLDMKQLTKMDIAGLVRTFSMYVKFPKSWWSIIEKAETDDVIFKKLNDLYINKIFSDSPYTEREVKWDELYEELKETL